MFFLLTGLVVIALNKTVVEVARTNDVLLFDELRAREKVDWTDYKYLEREKVRQGLGEFGQPVELNSNEVELSKNVVEDYSYNVVVSDRISLDRAVPDTRAPA